MKILLVEDEQITRLGLRKTIEKEEQFSIIAECSNGKQALEQMKLHQQEIDIILLDLNMPIMNGLEFLDHLDPSFDGQVIVLSSYDDLDHIKEAMKKGASDYFHKPTMSPKKIIHMLKEAQDELKRKSYPNLNEWIKEFIFHPSNYMIKNQEHWIANTKVAKVVVLMSVNDFDNHKLTNFDLTKLINKWKEVADFYGEFISYKDGYFLFIEKLPNNSLLNQYTHLNNLCTSLAEYLKDTKAISTSFGISQSIHDPMDLQEAIAEAETSLQNEFFSGRGTVHFYRKESTTKEPLIPTTKDIWNAFQEYKKEDLKAALNVFFQSLKKLHNRDEILSLAIDLKSELKRRMEKFEKEDGISPKSVVLLNYLTDIEKDVSEDFMKSLSWLIEFENKQFSPIIRHILQYLSEHYNHDVSLDTLANMVQTNPSYLSRVFKEQTGYRISDYITNIRIEKAKELLIDDHLRTKDVALAVGYANERYFSQLFKKITGMSPTHYKKQK